ncbi:DNA adenine methylase [Thermanaerosceptrum fracticalcis]|uniref:DNA adenine methylase n=1 Tax=Thermanaerosceptrum fracticalcis TaxID=1712410 RepID=A0A7G6E872_THEFR|nr:DNA adenine methylase [Thermanaerosceptrum fracticalcis]QNB48276.1 DNA adenine methylase [Thermanaerosceptrum fracticalcis]
MRYPGAKWRLARWIIEQMPSHKVYLEPYFGSGAVLFNKEPQGVEIINDIDGDVVNLFRVMREKPRELAMLVELTPWARDEYENSYFKTGDSLEDARRFLVRCWQAYATRTKYKTGWRHTSYGKSSYMPDLWASIPERIIQVARRLKTVQIENMDAVDLIEKHNHQSVLIYADPPYTLDTRNKLLYAHDMDLKGHEKLLDVLLRHKGPVMLSSYENELYNQKLVGWFKKKITTVAEKGQKKEEVIWTNFSYTRQTIFNF